MSWTPNFGYIGDGFNYLAGGVKNYNNYVGLR